MIAFDTLFTKDRIYISNKTNQEDIFREVYQDLLKQNCVTKDFLRNLCERERIYPTGIDLTPVDSSLPNIAIPHTESQFVKTSGIVPIKLNHPVYFYNMIHPKEELPVSFLFMILNQDGQEQTGLLASIMDFINSCDKDELAAFLQMKDTEDLFNFLKNNFKGVIAND
ncbi:PTS system galactose-specific IIA component [Tetragenococcus muriaticus PMC-11-5]|uniref:PTS system galactose-specific IIA component n=1 Tax=Tetragenococcus muriaticus PMC-11-5 TaxID=1302649 RepID=A0A091BYA5_9ENTE|nr:PTS sugar transporter subunit IIA [Tetragenococcus muriaticus]KFN89420.1 PTS system galactose-specific IIA component [Tetragenococcus muriaticus PMC-11-5]GMA48145.1 PTS sugar transporter subunit IIA [Tetragenococcus muriaticus]